MKNKLFIAVAALFFAVGLSAETVTLSGVKFVTTRTQVKDLGNGAFEVTIPPSAGWPMILIYPAQIPANPAREPMAVRTWVDSLF